MGLDIISGGTGEPDSWDLDTLRKENVIKTIFSGEQFLLNVD